MGEGTQEQSDGGRVVTDARGRSRAFLSLRKRIAIGVATLGLIAVPGVASAGFRPALCQSTWQTVPVQIGVKNFDRVLDSTGTVYQNLADSSWPVLMNANVQYLWPATEKFKTETGVDYLRVDHAGSPWTTSPSIYSGDVNLNSSTLVLSTIWQGMRQFPNSFWSPRKLLVSWHTDGSVGYDKSEISQVAVHCNDNQNDLTNLNVPIQPNTRVDGILIGTGDVVPLQVTQAANVPMLLVLSNRTPNTDFDFFASTTTTEPDETNFQWASGTSDPEEAYFIPATAAARTIYINVHSYAGAGQFTFHAHQIAMLNKGRAPVICMDPRQILTADDKRRLNNTLRNASAAVLKMTNGNYFIKDFEVYTGAASVALQQAAQCGVAPIFGSDRSYTYNPGQPNFCGVVLLYQDDWLGSGATLAHEYGHACLGLSKDEYWEPQAGVTLDQCGHSIMGADYTTLCTTKTHLHDPFPYPGAPTSPVRNSGWKTLKSMGVFKYGEDFEANGTTPDPTDYTSNLMLKNWVMHVKFDGTEYTP